MTWFAQRMTFVKSPWGKWSVYMGNMEKKQLIMTYSCLTPKSTKCGVRPITRVANSPAGAAWVIWKAPTRGMRRKNTFKSCCGIWTGSQTERNPSASEATLLWNNCYKTKRSPNSRNYTTLYDEELCPFTSHRRSEFQATPRKQSKGSPWPVFLYQPALAKSSQW